MICESLGVEVMTRFVRPLVQNVLENWESHRWSLQGFGMLRTYITKELRLHVWDSDFAVPDVSKVHTHPWNFESRVVVGRVVNTRYRAASSLTIPAAIAVPFIQEQIVCGPGGGLAKDMDMTVSGKRVWLHPLESETYVDGDTYRQEACEIHSTWCERGTVTLVLREFLPDTEHASVFYRVDSKWVSAEPREATPHEISAITANALKKF